MSNSITIKNENSGVERTLFVRQDVLEIAQASKQASQAIKYQQQAYIVHNPKLGTFLCIQAGAGSLYLPIRTDVAGTKHDVDGPETVAMTDSFRYTGEPIMVPKKPKR